MKLATFNILKYGNSISDEFGRQLDENLTIEVAPNRKKKYSYEHMMVKSAKCPKLPSKEIDPRNHYTNGIMDYRTENGHAIVYLTGYTQVGDIDKRIAECHAWASSKGLQ